MIFMFIRAACLEFQSSFSLQGHDISYDLFLDVPGNTTMVIINHIICNKLVEVLHVWL